MTVATAPATVELTVPQMLRSVLPEHTHVRRDIFGGAAWTWTTTAGAWQVMRPATFLTTQPWTVRTPYGELGFALGAVAGYKPISDEDHEEVQRDAAEWNAARELLDRVKAAELPWRGNHTTVRAWCGVVYDDYELVGDTKNVLVLTPAAARDKAVALLAAANAAEAR